MYPDRQYPFCVFLDSVQPLRTLQIKQCKRKQLYVATRNANENFVLADHEYCVRKARRHHIFFRNINAVACSCDDLMSADWLYKF